MGRQFAMSSKVSFANDELDFTPQISQSSRSIETLLPKFISWP